MKMTWRLYESRDLKQRENKVYVLKISEHY